MKRKFLLLKSFYFSKAVVNSCLRVGLPSVLPYVFKNGISFWFLLISKKSVDCPLSYNLGTEQFFCSCVADATDRLAYWRLCLCKFDFNAILRTDAEYQVANALLYITDTGEDKDPLVNKVPTAVIKLPAKWQSGIWITADVSSLPTEVST